MRDVRQILGAPEWLVVADMGETKDLHGQCIQLSLHFMGKSPEFILLANSYINLVCYLRSKSATTDARLHPISRRRSVEHTNYAYSWPSSVTKTHPRLQAMSSSSCW
jgi:hypothetical protein